MCQSQPLALAPAPGWPTPNSKPQTPNCKPQTHSQPANPHQPQARFSDALKSLQSQHLGATLKLLDPVNRLPLWAVTVKSKQI